MNKRSLLLLAAAAVSSMGMGGLSTCSSTTLDPTTIANAIKVACGIAVPAAMVLQVINAAAGATASMVISLICSSYKNAAVAQAAGGNLAAAAEVHFVVHFCDATGACKDIPVVAAKVN